MSIPGGGAAPAVPRFAQWLGAVLLLAITCSAAPPTQAAPGDAAAGSADTSTNQSGTNQTGANKTGANKTGANKTGANKTGTSNSSKPNAKKPGAGNAAADKADTSKAAAGEAGPHVLEVGATHRLKLPSQATQAAADGDSILIDPGNYNDCAVWHANHITIAARAPGVVFTGKTCQGKAIFVVSGNDITVRGITFTHAAVPDHNGAGIRAEGNNLTVEASHFIDNEEGILAGASPQSTIRIVGSEFRGNGTCAPVCAHGIYVGPIALLDVEDSQFTDTHQGHDIKSRALRTVIRGSDISDGPTGHSSYLVDIPDGGNLLMEHNTMSKGPNSDNPTIAVSIGEESMDNPTASLIVHDNSFTNLQAAATTFVENMTTTDADVTGNRLKGDVDELQGSGTSD